MCYGILGIVNICGSNFLVTVKSVGERAAGRIRDGVKVFEVQQVALTPFESRGIEANQKVASQVENFAKLFNGSGSGTGFYFSYHADLTLSHQEWHSQAQGDKTYSINLMKRAEYVWNFDLLKDFLLQGVSNRWFLPLIQGYCSTVLQKHFLGKPLEITLLSRRHTAKAGTRFHQRGIDESGNVANFVETELMVRYNSGETIFSHVQLRGSIPLFWSQKAKSSSKINFKDNRRQN